jgi:putative lipoprotein
MRRLTLLLCLLAGCASEMPAHVKGTAAYRELIRLPDDARLEATLEDVSKADAKAVVIGRARDIVHPGNPTAFVIPYDPARIDPNGRYAVRARIFAEGRLLFTTDQHYPLEDVVALRLRRAGTN